MQDVAESFGISKAHLVKCVHQLGVWGYLDNVRGRHGGFRLAREASQITVGEIIRKTEDDLDLVECFARNTDTSAADRRLPDQHRVQEGLPGVSRRARRRHHPGNGDQPP